MLTSWDCFLAKRQFTNSQNPRSTRTELHKEVSVLMKVLSSALLVLLALPSSIGSEEEVPGNRFLRQREGTTQNIVNGANKKYAITYASLNDEDAFYWDRLMQETDMSVAPTGAPPSSAPFTPPPTNVPETPPPPTTSPTNPPTNAPTEAPVSPSAQPVIPTVLPTVEPTSSPVATPQPVEPTASPETPSPTVSPTEVPVPPPTSSPVEPPSPSPTTESPESVPTEAPPTGSPVSPPPTRAPTPESLPTPAPTPEPDTPAPTVPLSPPPTRAPTPEILPPDPTPAPTPEPDTPAPTTAPETPAPTTPEPDTPVPTILPMTPSPTAGDQESCAVGLLVECFAPDGTTCEEAFPAGASVNSRPTSLSLRYIGGNCSQSFNQQEGLFSCQDLVPGGPATSSPVFIVAMSASLGTTYFVGNVVAGGVFEMTNNGDPLDSVVTISIFTADFEQTLLQTVLFDISGSIPLLMNDIFGSNQVVGWITAEGVVDSTARTSLRYDYTLSNEGTVPVNLQNLISNFTEGEFFFSQNVDLGGTVIPVGESLPPVTIQVNDVPLDEGRQLFLIESEVFGLNDVGLQCSATDETQTFFGYILPGQELPEAPSTA